MAAALVLGVGPGCGSPNAKQEEKESQQVSSGEKGPAVEKPADDQSGPKQPGAKRISEEAAFDQADREDTLQAYLAYLRAFPRGKNAGQALARLWSDEAIPGVLLPGSRQMEPSVRRDFRRLEAELIALLPELSPGQRFDTMFWLFQKDDLWWLALLEAPLEKELRAKLVSGMAALLTRKDLSKKTLAETATVLGQTQDPGAVGPLIAALEHEDYEVAGAAIRALGEIGDARAVAPLLKLMGEDHGGSWPDQAISALGAIGDPRAVEPLIAIVEEAQPDRVRVEDAARALGHIRDPRAVEALARLLRKSKDTTLISAAADALGAGRDPKAAEALIAALADPSGGAALEIARALTRFDDRRALRPLVAALKGPGSESLLFHVAGAVRRTSDPEAVDVLLEILTRKSWMLRCAAADALGRIKDPRAAKPLAHRIGDEDPRVREAAVRALLEIDAGMAIRALARQLRGDNPRAQMEAARRLISLESADAAKALLAGWKEEVASGQSRAMGVEDLGAFHDPEAVGVLIAALEDQTLPDEVRARAAGLLGDGKSSRAVEPLIALLRSDESPWARCVAANALGQIGDARALDALLEVLKCDNPALRTAAARALGSVPDARAVEPLIAALEDDDHGVRPAAAFALGQIGDWRAVEPLIAALEDKNMDRGWRHAMVESVTFALEKTEDRRPLETLVAVLADKKERTLLRCSAARALGARKDPRAVRALIAAVTSDGYAPVRMAAAEALGQLRDPASVEPMLEALRGEDRPTRLLAALVLGRIGDRRTADALAATLDGQDARLRRLAAEALVSMDDPRGLEALAGLLGAPEEGRQAAVALAGAGTPGLVRLLAALRRLGTVGRDPAIAEVLAKVERVDPIDPLAEGLLQWGAEVDDLATLLAWGWRPKTVDDAVRIVASLGGRRRLMTPRPRIYLLALWPEARRSLLGQLDSDNPKAVESAACALVWLGQEDTLPELVALLENKGSKRLAEICLASGRKELRAGAEKWASGHNVTLEEVRFHRDLPRWGKDDAF